MTFVGEFSDEELRALYRSARALVHPVDEDFGIAMAEAQACGTPVISIDAGGARDIVEDGVTGWLLPDISEKAVRSAVSRATRDELDAGEIRRRAERFAPSRFRSELAAAVETMVEAARRSNATPARTDGDPG